MKLFALGQSMQVVSPTTQLPRGLGRIISMRKYSNNVTSVTLNQPISGLAVGDSVFNMDFAAPNAIIRSNTFASFNGIFRVKSNGALFLNNNILDSRNANVHISADINPDYYTTTAGEGPSLLIGLNNGVYFNNNTVISGALNLYGAHYASLGPPNLLDQDTLLAHPLVYNPSIYRQLNPDLAIMNDADLIAHWKSHGVSEGRIANVGFNADEYLKINADLRQTFGSTNYIAAVTHYINYGGTIEQRQGAIISNPLIYNSVIYRILNPDLNSYSESQLAAHWIQHGALEGRQAQLNFKAQDYLILSPDLTFGSNNYASAMAHYITYGFKEGRQGSIYTHPLVYNANSYLSFNADLATIGVDTTQLTIHWLLHGINEGRRASVNFSSVNYLNRYPDLRAAYGVTNYSSAITQYVTSGYAEGRIGL